jgi:hypothetical protein
MTMEQKHSMRMSPGALAIGAVLMALGTGMLLDSYGLLSIKPSRLIAPFVLIALGTSMLLGTRLRGGHDEEAVNHSIRHGRRQGFFGGAWLVGVGCWLLISQTNMFGLTFGTSWPLLLILMGALISLRGWR